MCCQVCDTANSVTLHLHIRTQHLSDERFQAAEFHDEELVIRCNSTTDIVEHRDVQRASTLTYY